MARYYFDVHEDDHYTQDADGLELPTLEGAWFEAIRSLAELARDTIPRHAAADWDHQDHRMEIDVRDDGGPVLAVKVTFEASRVHRDR